MSGLTDRSKIIDNTYQHSQKNPRSDQENTDDGNQRRGRWGLRKPGAHLDAPIGGGDVEGGEAVVDGGAENQRRIAPDERFHGPQVATLDSSEEVVVIAGTGAAHPLAHPAPQQCDGLWLAAGG